MGRSRAGGPDRTSRLVSIVVGGALLAPVMAAIGPVFSSADGAARVAFTIFAVVVGGIGGVMVVGGIGRSVRAKRASPMVDPAAGALLVTDCRGDPSAAVYASCELTGVLSAPGVAPTAVDYSGYVRTSKWPVPGLRLPVVVDRAEPERFRIRWDQVGVGQEPVMRQAEWLAEQMRATGLPVLEVGQFTTKELRAAVRRSGAGGRAVIGAARPGALLPDGQEFHLDVWLQMDDGGSMRQQDVPVAVPADQVGKVTPGRIVPIRAAVVGGAVVTAYQWEFA